MIKNNRTIELSGEDVRIFIDMCTRIRLAKDEVLHTIFTENQVPQVQIFVEKIPDK